MMRRRARAARAATVIVLALLVAGCGGDEDKEGGGNARTPEITIGTKDFTEQYILGQLYSQALEANGFRVRLKSDIGSSEIVDRALEAGSLDMYPEYTGVLLSEIARRRREPRSSEEAYRAAKAFEEKRGFTLTKMTPFSDQNALAATPAFARRHGLETIEDLDRVPGGAVIGAPPEFRTRFEGLVGLREVYGLMRVKVEGFKIGEQYEALDKGRVGVAAVFTTDGQLVSRRYTILRDPRRLFAFQNVAPVIRAKLVKDNPKLATVLDSVSAKLTTEAMRRMNAAAVQDKQAPAKVARDFLRDSGLVPASGSD
jgi:osmoprotectant transport system substrate-binding protein